jgi:hypothetical protein
MFFTLQILFIMSTALPAMGMPPFNSDAVAGPSASASDAFSRNPNFFAYPNKDCIIIPIPGSGGCLDPEACHNAGGLCFAPKVEVFAATTVRCKQGNVDRTHKLGYKIVEWKARRQSGEIVSG